MREILFRGKRLANGEWAYGSIIQTDTDVSIWSEYLKDDVGVYPPTVGQYTGLTDSKGKKIFEGDILKWDEHEWGGICLDVVEWDYSLFDMRQNDWKQFCRIVGNIHDNSLEELRDAPTD